MDNYTNLQAYSRSGYGDGLGCLTLPQTQHKTSPLPAICQTGTSDVTDENGVGYSTAEQEIGII